MAPKRRDPNGEQPAPFAEIFPGESVTLSKGEPIMVRPWGAHAVIHEIPALLARLMGKLMPLRDALLDANSAEIQLPILAQAAAEELADLVAFSTGLSRSEIDGLVGADYLRLLRAMLRQNKDFFGEMSGLLRDVGEVVPGGFGWRRPSAPLASASES